MTTPEPNPESLNKLAEKIAEFSGFCLACLKDIRFPIDDEDESPQQAMVADMRNIYMMARIEGGTEVEAKTLAYHFAKESWASLRPEWEQVQRDHLGRLQREIEHYKKGAAQMRGIWERMGEKRDDQEKTKMEKLVAEAEENYTKAQMKFEEQLRRMNEGVEAKP